MTEKEVPQVRRGWLDQLPTELSRWQAEGLLSPEQAAAIRSLYPAPERIGSRLTRVLTVMAAILIGLSALLFVASHWESIDRWLKVTLLLTAMLASYGLGWWLAYGRGTYPRVGRALILLGCLIYGADIFLIAQIFHLQAHFPNGFLLWGLGTLAVAWATADELPLLLASAILAIWTGVEQGGFERLNPWYLVVSGALVLPLVWRLRTRWGLALSLVGAGVWWVVGAAVNFGVHGPQGGEATLIVAMLGLALYGIALYTGASAMPEWSAVALRLTGGTVSLLGCFVLSFADLLKSGNLSGSLGLGPRIATGVLLLLALAGAWLLARRERWEGVGAGVLALLAASLWLLPTSPWLALPTNLVLLGVIGGLLVAGYRLRSVGLLILALVGFGADVIARYFDFFWATLDRSLFFLAGGLLLLAVGWLLERQGRRLHRGWEAGSDA